MQIAHTLVIVEGPQGWKSGAVCLQKGEGQEKVEHDSIAPHPLHLMQTIGATFFLGIDFTAEFTSL